MLMYKTIHFNSDVKKKNADLTTTGNYSQQYKKEMVIGIVSYVFNTQSTSIIAGCYFFAGY